MLDRKMKQDRPFLARLAPRRARGVGNSADGRGTVTIFVAIWFLVIIGLSAVGIDGGTWYLMRRQAQDAADMAAVAGVQSILAREDYNSTDPPPTYPYTASEIQSAALTDAAQVATLNGFTDDVNNADVYINVPPSSGPYKGQPNTVQATVYTKAPFLLTAFVNLFSKIPQQTIGVSAVASLLARAGNPCVLTLHSDLTLTGSSITTANKCILASDATDSTSINIGNASTTNVQVTAWSMVAAGGCYRCTNSNVTLTQPAAIYQPPIPDPFASLDQLDFSPIVNAGNGSNNPYLGTATTDKTTNTETYTPGYYPAGIHISSSSENFLFEPGLYVLGPGSNNGLNITSGNLVICANPSAPTTPVNGCTFVILDGGAININGATVQFMAATAPEEVVKPCATCTATSLSYPSLAGMLFYQQDPTKTTGTNISDTIEGNDNSFYSGGTYLPGGNLTWQGSTYNASAVGAGNYQTASNICTEIVASSATFTGSASINIDNQACFGTAAITSLPQTVALVE